jgi:hypothetical protein
MRISRALVVSVVAVLGLMLVPAVASADYFQGFETDTSGWTGTLVREESGLTTPTPRYANGISSAAGGYHARIKTDGCTMNCGGPFTRWGKTVSANPVFPDAGYTTEIDVYLDTAWAMDHADRRFDFSSAINRSSDGSHLRDFAFNAGTVGATWVIGTSPNTGRGSTFPSNPCPSPGPSDTTEPNACRPPTVISTSGWYTLQHVFYDNAGTLSVDFNILDSDGGLVSTRTINTANAIGTVGGDRYGWFANEEVDDLAIDNAELRSEGPMDQKQEVRDSLVAKQETATGGDRKEIGEAIKHLDHSLEADLWVDDSHLDPRDGDKVFEEEKKAVDHLLKVKNTSVSQEIADLVQIDRDLAETAIDEIPATANNPKEQDEVDNERAKANQELAKGDADRDNGKPKEAIDHYEKAWEHAQHGIEHANK